MISTDNRDTAQHGAEHKEALLRVCNLRTYFPVLGGLFRGKIGDVRAVDDVSFTILPGETFGLVGESGCGKTTTGRTILRLQRATSGDVIFAGEHLLSLSAAQMKARRRDMQIIFQDPFSSLNPRMTVADIIGESLYAHGVHNRRQREKVAAYFVSVVGLPKDALRRFPHEFSGGQRQRVGVARALAVRPRFVVCDEPVSALDVSVQSQVINLLQDLQKEFGLTYLFIAHDLSVVEHISDRVGVMYLGKLVELAGSDELYAAPLHPYTKALLSAVPNPDPRIERNRVVLAGDVPSPINPPQGCRFHTRCPIAEEECAAAEPIFREISPGHLVACRRAEESQALMAR